MIRHLANFATPLHAVVHRLPFQWTSIEDTAVADYLSRLESGEPAETTYDDLPDAHLFHLATTPDDNEDGWITDMAYFLSTGLPPEHLTLDAKKRLAVRSRNFCLVSDIL